MSKTTFPLPQILSEESMKSPDWSILPRLLDFHIIVIELDRTSARGYVHLRCSNIPTPVAAIDLP